MKNCFSEHFGTYYDMALDAAISHRGYKKVTLLPVLPSQLIAYIKNKYRKKFRSGNFEYLYISNFQILILFFKWQIFTILLIAKRINSILRLRPLKNIKSIYLEDQFISFCIRNPLPRNLNVSYKYNPNFLTYINAIYNFTYGICLARFVSNFNKKNSSEIFLSHEIYGYASFVRRASSLGMEITIPLKLPFSYRIKPFTNYSRLHLPSFLKLFEANLNKKEISSSMRKVSNEYLLRRINPHSKELFYLRESPYSDSLDDKQSQKILTLNESSSKYIVIYLHKFTDDLHRYGIDEFDTIWDWTIFTLNQLILLTEFPIFVKIHPNTDLESPHLVHRIEAKVVQNLERLFYKNKRVEFLDRNFSNKPIICEKSSATIITHHGNIVCEATYFNIHTIVSKMSPWINFSNVETWRTINEYKNIISSINKTKNKKLSGDHFYRENLFKTIINYYHDKKLKPYQIYSFYLLRILSDLKIDFDLISEKSDSHSYESLNNFYKQLEKNYNIEIYDKIIYYLAKEFSYSNYI